MFPVISSIFQPVSAEKWSRRQREAVLDLSQNYNEVFISRELLEFVINEMNYKNLLGAFEVPYVCSFSLLKMVESF